MNGKADKPYKIFFGQLDQAKPKTCNRVGTTFKFKTMKKLIHSALLAIIAIGGASAVSAETFFYSTATSPSRLPITCDDDARACSVGLNATAFYTSTSPTSPQLDVPSEVDIFEKPL